MGKLLIRIFNLGAVFVVLLNAQNYHGAELRTVDSYLYGRFEVRFKPANGEGLVASFFTYNDLNPSTPWNEIDLEILGRYDNIVDFVTITSGQNIHKHNHLIDFDPHIDFHTYAVEWTPTYVAWFVDDTELFRQTQAHVPTLSEPQKIMMNIWLPVYEDWVGIWDDRTLPRFSYYDHVAYASFTPDSGIIGTNSDFSPQWVDNFDQYDSTRWEKSHDHTWGGNQALLVRENIVYDNGNLILCLTDPDQDGYLDNSPPAIIWARSSPGKIVARFSEEVDSSQASNPANFSSAAGTITGAYFWPDRRTVTLSVPDIDLTIISNLLALGMKDDSDPPNSATVLVTTIINPQPLTFPANINIGGSGTNTYLGDQWWYADTEYGREDGSATWTDQDITNTSDDTIYAASANRLVTYRVRVSPSIYRLILNFSENYYDQIGKRVFDIYCEGTMIASDLDLFALVGKNSAYNIIIDSLLVEDESIDIVFAVDEFGDGLYEWRGATLSGLIIEQLEVLNTFGAKSGWPESFHLDQNFPNPFNQSTSITFAVTIQSTINLSIFDLSGRLIKDLIDTELPSGIHTAYWNGRDRFNQLSPSGIYFYSLHTQDWRQSRKMLLLK